MKLKSLLFLMLVAVAWLCFSAKPSDPAQELMRLMKGSYTSAKQAKSDTDYFNISLKMYPIWPGKGNFLYVEQAMASTPKLPYRQRIYEIKNVGHNQFISVVYMIKNDKDFRGKWSDLAFFEQYGKEILLDREGCEVYLTRTGKNKYVGSTRGKGCASSLRGASYASSKVSIFKNQVISWDQGFNDQGEQVWGAEKAGYVFDKVQD